MDHDFEILGQKFSYPKTVHGTLCIVALIAGVVGIIWIFKGLTPEQIQTFSTVIYQLDGKKVVASKDEKHLRQLQFWTPSEETGKYLEKDRNGNIPPDDKWQDITTQKVEGFDTEIAKLIEDRKIDGYRRLRVFGHGRHRFKAGWWWVMTVYPDFKTDDFIKEYATYWNTSKTIYVEEINNEPHYVGQSEK